MEPEQTVAPLSPPSHAVTQAIRQSVCANLAPRRRASVGGLALRASAMLVGGLLAGGLVVTLVFGVEPAGFQWGMAASALAIALGVLWVGVLWVGTVGSRTGRHAKIGATLAAPVGFAVVIAVGKLLGGANATEPIIGCLGVAGLVALLPLAGLLLLLRRTDAMTPGWSAGLVGGVTGLVGAGSVSLACPSLDVPHLVAGHGLLVGLLAGACSYFFARLMAP